MAAEMQFTGRSYNIGGKTGFFPQFVNVKKVDDEEFMEEVVKEKGLALTAYELLHGVEAVLECGPKFVANDGRARAVSKYLKYTPVAEGNLDAETGTWNSSCRAYVNTQLLADATKEITGSFKNTSTANTPKLNYVTYVGAEDAQNVIMDDKSIGAYGNYMQFDAELGDSAELIYTDSTGAEQSIALTCASSDIAHAVFDFPAALKAIEAGKTLTFKMVSRCGKAEYAATTNTKKVTWLGSSDPYVANWSLNGVDMVMRYGSTKAVVTGANLSEVTKVTATLVNTSGTHVTTADEVTAEDSGTLKVLMATNTSDASDSNWYNKPVTMKFYDADGNVIFTLEGVTWQA